MTDAMHSPGAWHLLISTRIAGKSVLPVTLTWYSFSYGMCPCWTTGRKALGQAAVVVSWAAVSQRYRQIRGQRPQLGQPHARLLRSPG